MDSDLDTYFDARGDIFEQFGFEDTSYRVFPLEDMRDQYWMLAGGDKETGGMGCKVVYSDELFTPASVEEGKTICSGPVYTQRRQTPKWIWRTASHTMILVDTKCDLNIFLMVFDNAKLCVDAVLEEIYTTCWG